MKNTKINLGYLQISDWTPKQSLFSEWMHGEPKYKKEINDNPPETTVLKQGTYLLKITYPLNNPSVTKLRVPATGLSRAKLANIICKQYRKIYAEEDKTVGHKTGNIDGMLNRATSFGKYGIWGHNIGDLILHSAEVKDNIITVGVDS